MLSPLKTHKKYRILLNTLHIEECIRGKTNAQYTNFIGSQIEREHKLFTYIHTAVKYIHLHNYIIFINLTLSKNIFLIEAFI